MCNMYETGFIQKQNLCMLVLSKGSSNVWSKCADTNFYTTFVVCVSAAKSVASPLLILPGKRLNRGVIGGCSIEDANTTTVPKGFINCTVFLIWIEIFSKSVPGSVSRPLAMVYYVCCSHYNDKIVLKKS